jgi:hypothetical protein
MASHSNVTYTKFGIFSLGFALGLTNGLGLFCLALASMKWDAGTAMVTQIASLYHGYGATVMGGLYGAGWGFLEGFVFGVIFAIFYNLCVGCCSKKK